MGLDIGGRYLLQHPAVRVWAIPVATMAAAAALELRGDWSRVWLSYERDPIASGQVWRLLSGHFVHLGPAHLLLNVAGLLLVWALVGRSLPARRWLAVGAVSMAAIDAGFWVQQPQLQWYVGLSGLLHGLLAAGVFAEIRAGRRDAWLLAAMLAFKLVYETAAGPMPGSEAAAGGPVVVAAHLYGAIGGLLASVVSPVSPGKASI